MQMEKNIGIEKHAGKVRKKYFRSIFGSNENFKICFRDLLTFMKEIFKLGFSQNIIN